MHFSAFLQSISITLFDVPGGQIGALELFAGYSPSTYPMIKNDIWTYFL